MNNNRQPFCILYARLSRDDELQGESNSITNQRRLLEEYAKKNGFLPYENISDDGYSGTNFDRPGWQKLMNEVDEGHVSTLIIKDMSRMGRDYLRVGLYMETFREKGVRLIAVNDGVDTAKGDDDFTPFRNIISEWYARDTSRKIKSVLHAKGRDGKPLGKAMYGFIKDPDDKNRRLIDEEAATVVRRIFQMTIDGKGPWQIAKTFISEKIERPSYYLVRKGINANHEKCNYNLRYIWHGSTIIQMLRRREYMGDIVNFKTSKPSYKDKKQVRNPPEKQLIFENALPAIVDRETWELAQKMRKTVRRPDHSGEANPLTGLIYCADCGGKMFSRRSNYKQLANGEWGYAVDTFECSTYKNAAAKFTDACSLHYIRSRVVKELILETIRKVSNYAKNNEAEFIEKLREASTIHQAETAKSHKRQLAKNERRITELDMLFRKVYEDNATGKLSDERYEQLSSSYEKEQSELKVKNAEINAQLEAFESDNLRAENFMALVRKYTEFDTLTATMLNEFVDKVLVHNPDKSSGERVQRVDIYLNFIGNFEIPGEKHEPTPEEIETEKQRLAKKRKQNEYIREWRAKKKAAKQIA